MKIKLIFVLLIAILLTGCLDEDLMTSDEISTEFQTEAPFSVPKEKKEIYTTKLQQVLSEFYWRYDKASIAFNAGIVADEDDINFERISESTQKIGADIEKYKGEEAIVASVNLIHVNGDDAGTAYFYYVEDELAAAYHNSVEMQYGIYDFKTRNIYVSEENPFTQYEDNLKIAGFASSNCNIDVLGFEDVMYDNGINFLCISDNELTVYQHTTETNILKAMTFSDGDYPLSAAFVQGKSAYIAVLVGKARDEHSEDQYNPINAYAVYFYDTKYKKLSQQIKVGSDCTCVYFYNDKIVLGFSDGLEYYSEENGRWSLSDKIYFDHGVNSIARTEMQGKIVYAFTDGIDIFVYWEENETFTLLWRTYLSTINFSYNLYAGDLNSDGAKEIYTCDTTGTTIRYVFSIDGLISQNQDVMYGERIFTADFNMDGKDDYIKVLNPQTNVQMINIAN